MQYAQVFENPLVAADIRALTAQAQRLLLAGYLHRQSRLLQAFDQCYQGSLQALFVQALDTAIQGQAEDIEPCMVQVQARIPDTDDYPRQEGAWAQNLMIGVDYLLSFARQAEGGSLQSAVNAALDNIDLIHYEIDEHYDESSVVAREVVVVRQMLRRMHAYGGNPGREGPGIVTLTAGLML